MLHYLITEDRVRIIVTTPKLQVGRESIIARRDLNALIFQFREVLCDPARDARSAGKALFDVLVAPVMPDLVEAKAETLLVSLDGPLRYAPLAALWDGQGWLIERFRVVHFARAALDKVMSDRPAADSLAAFGCARQVPGFQELKAVPAELEGIVKRDAADPDGELPGVVKLDEAFSRDALMSALEAKSFTAVHIASHFVLGPDGEAESYLLLGDGSRFTLEDMALDLRFDGVDLLSLSACNTAIGEDSADGRELEGFATLALRLGARAVLATLWPVNDASTGLFMRTLYRMMRKSPTRSRADLLRSAMLAFIRGEVSLGPEAVAARGPRPLVPGAAPGVSAASGPSDGGGGGKSQAPPAEEPGASAAPQRPDAGGAAAIDVRHPRYWAPFVFIGNWR
jgi:CHAT domain-containing protein